MTQIRFQVNISEWKDFLKKASETKKISAVSLELKLITEKGPISIY